MEGLLSVREAKARFLSPSKYRKTPCGSASLIPYHDGSRGRRASETATIQRPPRIAAAGPFPVDTGATSVSIYGHRAARRRAVGWSRTSCGRAISHNLRREPRGNIRQTPWHDLGDSTVGPSTVDPRRAIRTPPGSSTAQKGYVGGVLAEAIARHGDDRTTTFSRSPGRVTVVRRKAVHGGGTKRERGNLVVVAHQARQEVFGFPDSRMAVWRIYLTAEA